MWEPPAEFANKSHVFVLDEKGEPKALPVDVEVEGDTLIAVSSTNLTEGLPLITGVLTEMEAMQMSAGGKNPFLPDIKFGPQGKKTASRVR